MAQVIMRKTLGEPRKQWYLRRWIADLYVAVTKVSGGGGGRGEQLRLAWTSRCFPPWPQTQDPLGSGVLQACTPI